MFWFAIDCVLNLNTWSPCSIPRVKPWNHALRAYARSRILSGKNALFELAADMDHPAHPGTSVYGATFDDCNPSFAVTFGSMLKRQTQNTRLTDTVVAELDEAIKKQAGVATVLTVSFLAASSAQKKAGSWKVTPNKRGGEKKPWTAALENALTDAGHSGGDVNAEIAHPSIVLRKWAKAPGAKEALLLCIESGEYPSLPDKANVDTAIASYVKVCDERIDRRKRGSGCLEEEEEEPASLEGATSIRTTNMSNFKKNRDAETRRKQQQAEQRKRLRGGRAPTAMAQGAVARF